MGWLWGTNLQDATVIGQALAADGFHMTVHPGNTPAPFGHADGDALVYLCDGRALCPTAPSVHDSEGRACSPSAPSAPTTPACGGHCLPRQLRAAGNPVPVLVIGPHGPNWTGCLDAGADDYVAAPYEPAVLCACLRALIRRDRCSRASVTREAVLRVGDLTLDRKRRTATRAGQLIALSQRETDLLEYLMTHPGAICSQEAICEEAWGCAFQPGTNTVHTNINRLRAKIDDGFETRLIATVHGAGYRLKLEP